MEVHDQHVSLWAVGQQQREGACSIEIRGPAQQSFASGGQVGRAGAIDLFEVDRGELIGDLPPVADVGGAGAGQPGARDRMGKRGLADRGAQALAVDASLELHLELHAPWLLLAVQVQVELIEHVERRRLHQRRRPQPRYSNSGAT